MPLNPFAFTPPQGFRDATFAPTDPPNETAFRDTMQDIPDQLKDELNTFYSKLNSTEDGSSGADVVSATPLIGGVADTVQGILEELKSSEGTLDAQNVKISGAQTITGEKTFSLSPQVPAPDSINDATPKTYVDVLNSNQTSALNTHKSSNDHDGRYYTEEEVDVIAANFTLGAIPDNSLETKKIKNVAVPPFSLTLGTNSITKTGLETTPLNVAFTPKHFVNLLGKLGGFYVQGGTTGLGKGWATNYSTALSLMNGEQSFTPTSQFGGIAVSATVVVGKIYCSISTIKTSSNTVRAGLDGTSLADKFHTGSNNFEKSGQLVVPTNTLVIAYSAVELRTSSFVPITTKQTYIINVTDDYPELLNKGLTNQQILDWLLANTQYADSLAVTKNPYLKSSHADGSNEECVIEGDFFTGDTLELKDGQVVGSKLWKTRTLYGKDYNWSLNSDGSGFKNIEMPITIGMPTGTVYPSSGNMTGVKYDGKILSFTNGTLADENWFVSGLYRVTIADVDSGWTETINPNADEVKSFMNGWKASIYVGSRYVGWYDPVNNTLPYSTSLASGVSASGQNKLNVVDGTKFTSGRLILVRDTQGVNFYTISSISENQLTLTPNLVDGVNDQAQVLMCDDGSSDTRVINFCKNNVATNYEGYKISYKLATAQPINEGSDSYLAPLKGTAPTLKHGVNSVTLDTGVVLGEVATPTLLTTIYFINDKNITSSRLRNKAQRVIAVRKNGNIDLSFTIETHLDAYGLQRAYCQQANFDPTATYTVDYEILDELAPQIGTAGVSYSEGLVDSVNGLYGIVETKQNQSEVLDTLVDLAMYEKTDTISLDGRFVQFSSSDYRIKTNVKLINKLTSPIITTSIISVGRLNGDGTITILSMSDVTTTLSVYKGNLVVRFSYIGADATTKTNLMSYGGFVNFTVTADCRGVI